MVGIAFATESLLLVASLANTEAALVTRAGAPFATDEGVDFAEERAALAFSTAAGVSAPLRDFFGAFGGGDASDFTDANRRKTRG